MMWGIVAIAFGIGVLIGLVYFLIRVGIPLVALIVLGILECIKAVIKAIQLTIEKNKYKPPELR